MRGVLNPRGESHARLLGSPVAAEEMGATVPWGWSGARARARACVCTFVRVHVQARRLIV
jgi:hypothetical protein